MSPRRAVLLTLGAVVLALGLAVGGYAAYRGYDRHQDRLSRAEDKAREMEEAATNATRELEAALAQVERERKRATDEYIRGLNDGRETDRKLGLDYDSGYNDAFEGFGGWDVDAYYIVFLAKGEGRQKYGIESRIKMEPCRGYQVIGVSSPSVFTHNEPTC